MNLVQISEHLKDVPMQALAVYANGKDPMVPAYMATGEMQRRETMKQRSAASQQAGQGQKPTVKEQIEQKAGLMSLQAQQQQQAQQQMMQQAQAQPMPTPPQTPQPSMQEEEQPEFAMGGIAQLPVNYDFANGGIIAFAGPDGSKVPVVEETEEEKKMRVMQELLSKGNMPMPSDPQKAGLQALVEQPPKDTRPGANIPGMYDTTAADIVKTRLTPRTMQEVFANQTEADKLAGVTGKYGEEQMKRYGEEDAQYKEMLKNREFNNTLALLSGMGRGGLGGAAPAYLQNQASQQAADIAQKRRMNELYGNVEAKQREEAMAKSKGALGSVETERTQVGDIASRMATTQIASQTEFAKEAINNKNQLDRQELQFKKDIQLAKDKQASELDLQKIREAHDFKVEELRRKNAKDLEQFRQNAPPEEQKNLNAYLARWKKNPANKNKPETDGVDDYFSARSGGQFTEGRQNLIGLHNLQVNYAQQLKTLSEDLTMDQKTKAAKIKALTDKLDDVNLRIEGKVGLPSLTGTAPPPPPGSKVD